MHLGGFARFIKQNPKMLDFCAERIVRKDWSEYKRKYLKEWVRLDFDQKIVQSLCAQRAAAIRWGTISKDWDNELRKFCEDEYKEKIGKVQVQKQLRKICRN